MWGRRRACKPRLFSVVTIFVVVYPTKRADLSRHGYRAAQFEDALARFLTTQAEHPNRCEFEAGVDVAMQSASLPRAPLPP